MNQKEINETILNNMGLIINIAKKAHAGRDKRSIDLDDYIQEAVLITSEVLERYSRSKGKLSSFIYTSLSKKLINYSESALYPFRVPPYIYNDIRKLKKYCSNNNIDISELNKSSIKNIISRNDDIIDFIFNVISDTPITFNMNEEYDFSEINKYKSYNSIDNKIDIQIRNNKLNEAMSKEKLENIDTIEKYYKEGMTYQEIGKLKGISLEAVRVRIKATQNRLKKRLINDKEILFND